MRDARLRIFLGVIFLASPWAKTYAQMDFQDEFEASSGELPAGWSIHPDQPFDEVKWIFNDLAFVRNGNGSLKLVNSNSDHQGHIYLRDELPADHQKNWVLEFYAKGQGDVGAALYLYHGTEEGRTFLKTVSLQGESGESATPVDNLDGEWVKCRFRIPGGTLPPEVTAIRPVLTARGTVYIDDLSLSEEGAKPEAKSIPLLRPNLLQLAPVAKKPVLDGVISEGEYPASFTGLIDNKARAVYSKANRTGMGRDAERLYFAMEVQLPPGLRLPQIPAKRDDATLVAASPAFLLVVRPDSATEKQVFEAAYLAVSPAGGFYDAWQTVNWDAGSCERNAAFQADWQIKTTAEDGRFVVELSVPLRDLKIDPEKTEEILCSFGLHLPETIISWQMVGIWFDHPFAFGLLGLKADSVAVQVDSLGALNRGQISPQFDLRNFSEKKVKFEAQSLVSPPKTIGGVITGWVFSNFNKGAETVGADKPEAQWSTNGEVAPGTSTGVSESSRLKTPGSYVLENQVRINGTEIYYQKLPFRFSEPIVVALSPFPARDVLRAKVTLSGSPPEEKGSLAVTARSPEGKTLWQQKYSLSGDDTEAEIPLSSLAIGKNHLDFQLFSKNGEKASIKTELFVKRDIPAWLAKRAGIGALDPDWAPLPWGPIRVEGSTISVWGRTFSLSPGALLGDVTSQGTDLLRAPAIFKYRTAGTDHPVPLSAPRIESVHAGRVVIMQEAATPHFQIVVRQTIEFDGMNAVELRLSGRSAEEIDALWLELPLAVAELSTFVTRAGSSGFAYEHGLFSLALPSINRPGLIANLWIGNEKVGLSYFAESYKGWLIDSRKPRIEASEVVGGGAILKINLINDPSVLPENTVMQFGLQPSPYRPKFTGYRKWRWGDQPEAPVNLWYTSGQMWTANDIQYVPRTWQFLDDLCTEAKNRGLSPLLYVCGFATSPWEWIRRDLGFDVAYYQGKNYPADSQILETSKSTINEDFAYFQEDWNLRPRTAALFDPPTREQVFFSAGTSWSDYAVYQIAELLKRTSIRSLFFDISYPNTNFDEGRGLAYQTKDGVREGTTEFLAARDFYKRIYYVFGEHRDENSHPWIMGHSFASTAPLSSFFDAAVNGEEIKPVAALDFGRMASQDLLRGAPIAKPEAEYRKTLDGAAYRAIFGPQFGPVNFILPQYAYLPELKTRENTRDVLAATFVHNSQLWNAYVETSLVYDFWNKVEVPFGMGDSEFHGYWENGIITSPAGVKVSYWKKPGSEDYLVAVANWTENSVEASVKLPKSLLIAGKGMDMESGKEVPVGSEWLVPVPAHDLRVFRIRAGGELARHEEKAQK